VRDRLELTNPNSYLGGIALDLVGRSAATSGLSSTGTTTEACMLKASAVDGQPAPSAT
jgi:hypothetical protein